MTSTARPVTKSATALAGDLEYREVDLRRVVRAFWRRRMFLCICAVAGMLLAYGGSWLIHPEYDATVRLMPPQPKSGGLSLLMSTHNPGDQYLGLLKSRTVADDVIEHQHLAEYFHTTRPSQLRKALSGIAKITVDKDQFVTVTVRTREPETSLRIANEFPAALYRLNDTITRAAAQHQLQYFEDPLEEEQNKLLVAERDLTAAQQKTGIPEAQAQLRLGVGAIAELRQQIVQRQEQLAGLEAGRTSENPQVMTMKSQIASLQAQLHRLEAETGGAGGPAGSAKLPEQAMQVAEKERQVKYHETLFEVISKLYEGAKLDDAYSPPVELVDRAVLPDQKSWPPRKLFALGGLVLGGLIGAVMVLAQALEVRKTMRSVLSDASAL